MNKKLLLAGFVFIGLMASRVEAAQPTFIAGRDSAYVVTNSSVAVSSAPTTYRLGGLGLRLPAVAGYRKVKIVFIPNSLQDGTSIFWNTGASTANIYSQGYRIRISTVARGVVPNVTPGVTLEAESTDNEIEIESNSQINVMTAQNVTPVNARTVEYRIPN